MEEFRSLVFPIQQYVGMDEDTVEITFDEGLKIRFDIHISFKNA